MKLFHVETVLTAGRALAESPVDSETVIPSRRFIDIFTPRPASPGARQLPGKLVLLPYVIYQQCGRRFADGSSPPKCAERFFDKLQLNRKLWMKAESVSKTQSICEY
jgi:hypothetical protein